MGKSDKTKKSKSKKSRVSHGVISLYPSRKNLTFEWSKIADITTGTTQDAFGTAIQLYLNSMTPLITSPGYRVQGYNQVKDIYNKYKVFACKVKIVISNPTGDGLYAGFRIHNSNDADGIFGENPGTADMKKWTWVKPFNSEANTITYERYLNIGAIEGLTKSQFSNEVDKYSGNYLTATAPTNKPYVEASICNPNNATSFSAQVQVNMTFYTHIYDRQTLSNSAVA